MAALIPTRIVASACPSAQTPSQVAREFHRWIEDGATIRALGDAREDPLSLLSRGYTPRYKVELFDTTYCLTNVRRNADLGFFIGYVVQGEGRGREIHPRLFYKDLSLVWRSASHFIQSDQENWIGKGDTTITDLGSEEVLSSVEATTDLPLEIQTALETLGRAVRPRRDENAVRLVLRRAPDARIEPYRDFTEPRRRARANRRNLINRGRSVARFTRKCDPTSLVFARGFEPDLRKSAILERSRARSRFYGGMVRRFRIPSRNRKIQFMFFAGPRQVWISAPQATTTEIMSYGVRTIDVVADEDLSMPGYEYHSIGDGDPADVESQIPEGFAGAYSEIDETRADASLWLDQVPIIQQFRKKILGQSRRRRR
ncbi:MAG: hypothetical protein O7G30_18025 [Proteobacteria bacterium]|nr:hypothetical protein [Pseudomonadota bacterium]